MRKEEHLSQVYSMTLLLLRYTFRRYAVTRYKEQHKSKQKSRKLKGKVAIVTGGASGIEEATARLFAIHSAQSVVIADIQDEKTEPVAASIPSQIWSYVQCEVSDENQVKAMVDWTVQQFGQLDIMFSNSGSNEFIMKQREQTRFLTVFGIQLDNFRA
ncbi:(-)-isopiperitenol/(-)-carveol dehydrogenase, mitochondrial-like [Solanum tuberosum]|uniref:(-)-isopiperitenol/(-)-carveol dehydrogenase, mitochondrial-like n=1 Tax=Solanum tuberosum TaxID=4113 RepID=UPI00073A5306|nr:PREDICTED: (-)-isopiperitenol/(-)-carveol dehydrogenase, mitochondrial-like [Solanum tuberosum]